MKITLRQHYQLFPNMFEAASDVGVDKNNYQLWLSGKAAPSFESCRKLMQRGINLENFPD